MKRYHLTVKTAGMKPLSEYQKSHLEVARTLGKNFSEFWADCKRDERMCTACVILPFRGWKKAEAREAFFSVGGFYPLT